MNCLDRELLGSFDQCNGNGINSTFLLSFLTFILVVGGAASSSSMAFSRSSSADSPLTISFDNYKNKRTKPKRKVIILRIPIEITNPEDIHSVLPYVCEQEERIVAAWSIPRSNKRKVCVLIESWR